MVTKFLYHNQYPKRPELEVSNSNSKLNVLCVYWYFLPLNGRKILHLKHLFANVRSHAEQSL